MIRRLDRFHIPLDANSEQLRPGCILCMVYRSSWQGLRWHDEQCDESEPWRNRFGSGGSNDHGPVITSVRGMLSAILIDEFEADANRIAPAQVVAPLVDLADRRRFVNSNARGVFFANWQKTSAHRNRLAAWLDEFLNVHRLTPIHAIVSNCVPATPGSIVVLY